jgi:hypothetical protein
MTDFDVFEQEFEASLRRYADEAPGIEDPAGLATAIAVGHPRRRGWSAGPARPAVRAVGWVLLGAVVILAVLALIATGAGRLPSNPFAAESEPIALPKGPMPDELFSVRTTCERNPTTTECSRTWSLDVNDAFLLREAGTGPLEWAGTAAEFVPGIGDAGDLVIRATGPCGEGRYSIRTGAPPVGATPEPSAAGGNPTPPPGVTPLDLVGEGSPFVLIPVNDSCAERVAILTSGPWEPERVELVTGRRYDSMSFTEPFEFVMPATDSRIPPAVERSLTKGVLRIGNGYSWSSSFHDDVPVFSDVCDTGSPALADIPATPEEVGAWLRSSRGLSIVDDPMEVTVDGRPALAFVPVEGCASFDPPLGGTQFNLGSIVFAIPTGDDTILYVVGGDGGDEPSDAAVAVELVRSMTFR